MKFKNKKENKKHTNKHFFSFWGFRGGHPIEKTEPNIVHLKKMVSQIKAAGTASCRLSLSVELLIVVS